MNIFYLDHDVNYCARDHLDKHVVKMISEYIQLLSTAHRLLDGTETLIQSPDKSRAVMLLLGESASFIKDEGGAQKLKIENQRAAALTHQNHPSGVWVRQSSENYLWLWKLTEALHEEWLYRYPKEAGVEHIMFKKYKELLSSVPKNLPVGKFFEPPQAMPDKYKVEGNSAQAYRNYYVGSKFRFAKWKNRLIPSWYHSILPKVWNDDELVFRLKYVWENPSKTQITSGDYFSL